MAAARLPDQVMTNVIMLMDAGYQNRLPDQRVKRVGDDSFKRQKPGTMGPAPTKGAKIGQSP